METFLRAFLLPSSSDSATSRGTRSRDKGGKEEDMPGVVAWIAAADVPGSNLWGGNGVADEELFPIETVLYVSKIIGVISTDNPDIGAAARSTLLHFL